MHWLFRLQRCLPAGLLALAPLFLASSAQANIYGFIDEQGVAHFATEKIDPRYQLFLHGTPVDTPDAAPTGPAKPELLRYLAQHPNLRKFAPLVTAASKRFRVDAALLKAVMAAESAFNADAISPKGAIGLMQILPATAERYGVQGDNQQTVEQKLADPATNIRLGARYLRDLSRQFPNRQDLVLAAYNAGEGAVRQYRSQIPPYPETRNYVQLVTQFHQLYQGSAVEQRKAEKLLFGAGAHGGRIRLTIPGRRNMPVAPVALSE